MGLGVPPPQLLGTGPHSRWGPLKGWRHHLETRSAAQLLGRRKGLGGSPADRSLSSAPLSSSERPPWQQAPPRSCRQSPALVLTLVDSRRLQPPAGNNGLPGGCGDALCSGRVDSGLGSLMLGFPSEPGPFPPPATGWGWSGGLLGPCARGSPGVGLWHQVGWPLRVCPRPTPASEATGDRPQPKLPEGVFHPAAL